MTCDQQAKIHAYHDGEIKSQSEIAAIESHLASCAECRELLEDLRRISSMFTSVELPAFSVRSANQMKRIWLGRQERGIRRFAGGLTAVAAALMLVMMRVPSRIDSNSPRSTADDALAMSIMPPDDTQDSGDVVRAAQWMAADLSQGRP